MWWFLAETGHVGEWDRTSSTKSWGGGIIRMSTKIKQGVPENLCYISWVTEELLGIWVFDDKGFQVFGAQSAGDSTFDLDSPGQTTVKLPLRFGFV